MGFNTPGDNDFNGKFILENMKSLKDFKEFLEELQENEAILSGEALDLLDEISDLSRDISLRGWKNYYVEFIKDLDNDSEAN